MQQTPSLSSIQNIKIVYKNSQKYLVIIHSFNPIPGDYRGWGLKNSYN